MDNTFNDDFFFRDERDKRGWVFFPPQKSALKIFGERRRVERKLDSVGVFAMELFYPKISTCKLEAIRPSCLSVCKLFTSLHHY